MAASKVLKVLIAGEVQGRLSTLFSKVSSVNSKNGPFDVLFCVGAFFAPEQTQGQLSSEVLQYMQGVKQAPLPTYFIGGYGQGSEEALAALEETKASGSTKCNIHYLGRRGVKEVAGLSVVFLDGESNPQRGAEEEQDPRYFCINDVKQLQRQVEAMEGDVDILLTCEWPRGVTDGVAQELLPDSLQSGDPAAASALVADVASFVRPRYHFAGGLDLHFARPPYFNKDFGAGVRATRFVALASVSNTAKQKSLHALGLTPAAAMTPDQLSQKPEGATPSPYDKRPSGGKKRGLEADGEDAAGATSADWRWQKKTQRQAKPSMGRPGVVRDSRKTVYVKNVPFTATEDQIEDFFAVCGTVSNVLRTTNEEGKLHGWALVQFETEEAMERACDMNGMELMGRPLHIEAQTSKTKQAEFGKAAASCWFCLSSSAADVSLIVSVAEETYLTLDKGPINDYHGLIIPIEHYPSMVSLSAAAYGEMERYLSAMRSCLAAVGKEMVAFERFLTFRSQAAGNHCHVNVAAIPAAAAKSAGQELLQAAKAAGFSPSLLPKLSGEAGRERLREMVGDGEYFQFFMPNGSRWVQPLSRGDRWPLNLGREVIAKLAGVPDRADWKAATVSDEEAQKLVEQFKKRFAGYDIMQ